MKPEVGFDKSMWRQRIESLTKGQRPIAVVVAPADSRVHRLWEALGGLGERSLLKHIPLG